MIITETGIDGLKIIEPRIFADGRGWFAETYTDKKYFEAGIPMRFVQDNHVYSAKKGTLRGLHFQTHPKAQTKLVRCLKGAILDAAVDLRKASETYKKWFVVELNAQNQKQLLIPKGFAHGYITLADDTEVFYKVDEYYWPQNEGIIVYNDPEINVDWGFEGVPALSDKDRNASLLKDLTLNF